jgi:ribosomal protein S10
MQVVYSLKIKSIHVKYLLLGVLAFLDLLKKKEQVSILGIQTKQKKIIIQKYTVLKSPFINKKSREQFKLQLHVMVILFSVLATKTPFWGGFVEAALLAYLRSQYLEIKLLKSYTLKVYLAEW